MALGVIVCADSSGFGLPPEAPSRPPRPPERRGRLGVRVAACVWLAMVTAAGSFACEQVTSDNVALWKTTEKGPVKLAAALRERAVEPKLRAEAAIALIDIGKADEVDSTLAALPANERWDLMKTLVPSLSAAMAQAGSPEKALSYRDALFSLRAGATPEDQGRIDAALLPGIEQALKTGRVPNGRHSVEKILQAMGPSAGATLARLLAEPIPNAGAVAELLARVGDEGARDTGAANLVARAGRQHPIPDATWKALGQLGGPSAAKFFQDKIEHGDKDEARSAARALQQRREPQLLTLALKVAADAGADRTLRDEIFGVVETIGGPQAQAGLIHIIATDKEEMVRYHAFESALAVGKTGALVPALEAFPSGATYKKVDVDDLLVKLIEKLGPSAHPELLKALASKIPLARMTAVMSLEHLGKASDAAPLENLGKDTTMIKGFPAGQTIGKEATRVAAAVRSKS
jgi:hypothetical protein